MFSNADIGDVGVFSLRHHGAKHRLADGFVLGELACRDGSDIVLVHPDLALLLSAIRRKYGGPIHINSAYRTHAYNVSIGGKPNSAHLWGMAADVWTPAVYPSDVAAFVDSLGAGGVGDYPTFTHVDVLGQDRRW